VLRPRKAESNVVSSLSIKGRPFNFIHADERVKPMAQAKQGDVVRVNYRGTLEDGTAFSSTYEEKEPFEFTLGKGNVLPRFEQAVIGMNEGDTRSISVPPEEAYGQHRKEFVFVMNRTEAPVSLKLELGNRLQIRTNQGKMAIATITVITEDSVILDANDPLAGKTLNFEIELLKIL
jgi:peptidylprolyl isomerase